MTLVEPRVSTALSRLTTAPRRTRSLAPTARARVITGSSPSGTSPTRSPTAKTTASEIESPATSVAIGMKAMAPPTAIRAISQATLRTWFSSGRRLARDALRERGDPAELGVHAGRVDQGAGLALDAAGPGEDQVPGLEPRDARVGELGVAIDGRGLPGERRHVDLERSLKEARVGRDPLSLLDQQHVARDELGRRDAELLAVAEDPRLGGEIGGERLHRAFGLELLDEGEDRVDEDHDDDRDRHGDDAGDPGESRRRPEEQRQRMGELARQVAQMAALFPPADLVGPVLLEPSLGLAPAQAGLARPEMLEQQVQALLRVHLAARQA